MSTDLTTTQPTGLAIAPEQTRFTDDQRAVLAHMGVENAPDADLQVFMHVCQRTGLDPFARQIHMIGRNSKNYQTQQWETKYTIQTGIDGYRVVGHRAADRTKTRVSVEAPEWAHEDGTWRPVWSKGWGWPVAARVTIRRNGDPFTAVALFDEYKQTKKDGNLTQMWAQRPAGQLAKCAEALAWRMALPHDLAGIYVDEEMQHADNRPADVEPAERPRGLDAVRAAVAPARRSTTDDNTEDVEVVDDTRPLTDHTRRKMFALLSEVDPNADAETQRKGMALVLGRPVESRASLSEDDALAVIDALQAELNRRNIATETGGE